MNENKELTREEAEKYLVGIKENIEALTRGFWNITIGVNVTDHKINKDITIPVGYRDLVISAEHQEKIAVK